MLAPIYIPTNSVRGCPSLHTLSSIYCLWVKRNIFIYLLLAAFVAAQGLSLVTASGGYSLVVVCGLIVVAFVAEHVL